MTGVTLQLTPWQERELRFFASGHPRRPLPRPNTNLIRRGMLELAPASGYGYYRITALGLAALEAASS